MINAIKKLRKHIATFMFEEECGALELFTKKEIEQLRDVLEMLKRFK
jgi:hypothetical protein